MAVTFDVDLLVPRLVVVVFLIPLPLGETDLAVEVVLLTFSLFCCSLELNDFDPAVFSSTAFFVVDSPFCDVFSDSFMLSFSSGDSAGCQGLSFSRKLEVADRQLLALTLDTDIHLCTGKIEVWIVLRLFREVSQLIDKTTHPSIGIELKTACQTRRPLQFLPSGTKPVSHRDAPLTKEIRAYL